MFGQPKELSRPEVVMEVRNPMGKGLGKGGLPYLGGSWTLSAQSEIIADRFLPPPKAKAPAPMAAAAPMPAAGGGVPIPPPPAPVGQFHCIEAELTEEGSTGYIH